MGAMPGALTVGLFVGQGLELLASPSPSACVVGVASGALIDILVIRRFARSSRLVLTVATIGLAQVLGAIGLVIGVALGTDALIGNIETPLSGELLRPAVPGPRRPPPDARRRAGRARRARLVPARAPTPAARCGPPPRTRTGPCCSASRCAGCRRSCGRSPAACPRSPSSPRRRSPASCPSALVGATDDPPRPRRRRDRPVPVAARSRSAAGIGLGIAEWTIRWNVTAESIFDVTSSS